MGPALISYSHYPGVPPCESRADPVAAKRKRKRKTPVATPWLALALGVAERLVPGAGLGMPLGLGQVDVGAAAPVEGLAGTVEEGKAEVDERGGGRPAGDLDGSLGEVPAAWADDQRGGRGGGAGGLAALVEGEGAEGE